MSFCLLLLCNKYYNVIKYIGTLCREINHSLASKPLELWLMIKIIIFTTGSYIEDIACQNEKQYKFNFFVLKTLLYFYKRVHLDNKIQYSSHCVSFFLQTDCLQKQLSKSRKQCDHYHTHLGSICSHMDFTSGVISSKTLECLNENIINSVYLSQSFVGSCARFEVHRVSS